MSKIKCHVNVALVRGERYLEKEKVVQVVESFIRLKGVVFTHRFMFYTTQSRFAQCLNAEI